jgi:hypothetical protein
MEQGAIKFNCLTAQRKAAPRSQGSRKVVYRAENSDFLIGFSYQQP